MIAEVRLPVSTGEPPRYPATSDEHNRLVTSLLLAMLAATFVIWLVPLRVPLWLDETVSYSQISNGFSQIWQRRAGLFPAYYYLLWLAKTLFGSSVIALRAPSVLAMLAATFVLFRISREFFSKDIALAISLLFSLHPYVVFAAIDARPYAIALLVVNCAILSLVMLEKTHATRYAIALGVTSALIFYFHYLFAVILAAFAMLLLAYRRDNWPNFWKQLAISATAFTITMLPVLTGMEYLFRTRGIHVFSLGPTEQDFINTFAPEGTLFFLFCCVALVAASLKKLRQPPDEPELTGLTCLLLAFIPLVFLFVTSRATSLTVFVERYRLVAIPGIALCWGLLLSRIDSKLLRIGFCFAVLAIAAREQLAYPHHSYSWKDAIDAANAATRDDHAPILICSDLPESDHLPMPANPAQSDLFAPLSYYPLHSPVVPLPRTVNDTATSQVHTFLASRTVPQRFLAMAYRPSTSTLKLIDQETRATYKSHELGNFDGVSVVEYLPK